ncbi:hypothetical protein HXX76_014050 [Chlamydomonas incerta]|uniref:Uncharacterized protein n=1 Tax=Chlamydomonas incerta TaxID=51695 RepID=A0A835SHD7_CHLIN|nr:hypothetical protein HXX76_014050 [Chlamydomonas incerta]|eukprot:KAG2424892.1 hypothetical protein HXX76_014050 [Chlamydomonas incerta]
MAWVYLVIAVIGIICVQMYRGASSNNLLLSLRRAGLNNRSDVQQYSDDYYRIVFSSLETMVQSSVALGLSDFPDYRLVRLPGTLVPPAVVGGLDSIVRPGAAWASKKADYARLLASVAQFQAPFVDLLSGGGDAGAGVAQAGKLLASSELPDLIKGARLQLLARCAPAELGSQLYFSPASLLRLCSRVEADLYVFARGGASFTKTRAVCGSSSPDRFLLGYLYGMGYLDDKGALLKSIKDPGSWLGCFAQAEAIMLNPKWSQRYGSAAGFFVNPDADYEAADRSVLRALIERTLRDGAAYSDARLGQGIRDLNSRFFVPVARLLNGVFSWHPLPKDRTAWPKRYQPSESAYSLFGAEVDWSIAAEGGAGTASAPSLDTRMSGPEHPAPSPRRVLDALFVLVGNTDFRADVDWLAASQDATATGAAAATLGCGPGPGAGAGGAGLASAAELYSAMRVAEAYVFDVFTTYYYPEDLDEYQERAKQDQPYRYFLAEWSRFSMSCKAYWNVWWSAVTKVYAPWKEVMGASSAIYKYLTTVKNYMPMPTPFAARLQVDLFEGFSMGNILKPITDIFKPVINIFKAIGNAFVKFGKGVAWVAKNPVKALMFVLGFVVFLWVALIATVLHHSRILGLFIFLYAIVWPVCVAVVTTLLSLLVTTVVSLVYLVLGVIDSVLFRGDARASVRESSLTLAARRMFMCKELPGHWYMVPRHHEGNRLSKTLLGCSRPCPASHRPVPSLGSLRCEPCAGASEERQAFGNDAMIARDTRR